MKIIKNGEDPVTHGSVCAIGSFDGIHKGHQMIVSRLHEIAAERFKVGIITFLPLPFFVIKGIHPMYLTAPAEKEEVFRTLGIDFIFYFNFEKHFAQRTPQAFVNLIIERIKPSHVVVGENFHFGAERSGSALTLQTLAQGSFDVHIVDPVISDGIISSTRIRELLLLGHVTAANSLLGRRYSVTGTVVKGKGKGAHLGFPTINIHTPVEKLLPLDGVYAAYIMIDESTYQGALFLKQELIEVHIIDFNDSVYARSVTIEFVKRIRSIESFQDEQSLIKAIMHDVQAIRDVLGGSLHG